MTQDSWGRSVVRGLVRWLFVGLIALGAAVSGPELRHATAASLGCDNVNAVTLGNQPSYTMFLAPFDAGDTVSLTAADPSSGSPISVQIAVDGIPVAIAPFPGTASYVIPTTGVIDMLMFSVNTGTATLDINCVAAAAPTATATATETATATPTETATATPTETTAPTVPATPTPTEATTVTSTAVSATGTATATEIPATAAPATEVPT